MPQKAARMLIIVENIAAGLDHRVSKQVTSLAAAGYAVHVITRRHAGNDALRDLPAVRLHEYPPPPERDGLLGYLVEYAYSFLMAAALSLRVMVRGRVDVVQFCQPPDVYFLLAPFFRLTGTRVLVDQRDLMRELYQARYGRVSRRVGGLLGRLEWLSQRSADHILCVNGYLRQRALAASGLPRKNVSIVRNGPRLDQVAAAAPDPALRRGRCYLCCWVGMIGRQDRVDLLIRSIQHVVHQLGRTDCQFAVIGDGECLGEARSLARELRVEEWVEFPGFLPVTKVFSYLATADLGLDASMQIEVSPVKAMEYMAFGLPVVAFDLPETRAIADVAAACAVPGDVAGHARAIDDLLADPARRAALGSAGEARVRTELAWEHQARGYLAAVERLHGARVPRG